MLGHWFTWRAKEKLGYWCGQLTHRRILQTTIWAEPCNTLVTLSNPSNWTTFSCGPSFFLWVLFTPSCWVHLGNTPDQNTRLFQCWFNSSNNVLAFQWPCGHPNVGPHGRTDWNQRAGELRLLWLVFINMILVDLRSSVVGGLLTCEVFSLQVSKLKKQLQQKEQALIEKDKKVRPLANAANVKTFALKSDQDEISPAAPPEILHHTVWRTWLFTAYLDERWFQHQFSLPHLYIIFLEGLFHCRFQEGVASVCNIYYYQSRSTFLSSFHFWPWVVISDLQLFMSKLLLSESLNFPTLMYTHMVAETVYFLPQKEFSQTPPHQLHTNHTLTTDQPLYWPPYHYISTTYMYQPLYQPQINLSQTPPHQPHTDYFTDHIPSNLSTFSLLEVPPPFPSHVHRKVATEAHMIFQAVHFSPMVSVTLHFVCRSLRLELASGKKTRTSD